MKIVKRTFTLNVINSTQSLVKSTIKAEAAEYLKQKPNMVLVKGSRTLEADYQNFMDQSALDAIVIFMEEFIKATPEISK